MPKTSKTSKKRWHVIRPPLGPGFELPSREDLLKVKPDDVVKLIFQAGDDAPERMWVLVEKCDNYESWVGRLDNDPAQQLTASVLKYKDKIVFHPLDVINIDSEEEVSAEKNEEQVLDQPLDMTDNLVNKRWYKNSQIIVPAVVALLVGLMTAVATLAAALIARR